MFFLPKQSSRGMPPDWSYNASGRVCWQGDHQMTRAIEAIPALLLENFARAPGKRCSYRKGLLPEKLSVEKLLGSRRKL